MALLARCNLVVGIHRLHGQELTAHLHQRQGQLTQYVQLGHGPGGGYVELLPMLPRRTPPPGRGRTEPAAGPWRRTVSCKKSMRLPRLSSSVRSKSGSSSRRGIPGNPAPGAHVHHRACPGSPPAVSRQAQSSRCSRATSAGFGDGRQVHDLVLLQQPPGKLRQCRDASACPVPAGPDPLSEWLSKLFLLLQQVPDLRQQLLSGGTGRLLRRGLLFLLLQWQPACSWP